MTKFNKVEIKAGEELIELDATNGAFFYLDMTAEDSISFLKGLNIGFNNKFNLALLMMNIRDYINDEFAEDIKLWESFNKTIK